jgi:predicted transcriptional regulator
MSKWNVIDSDDAKPQKRKSPATAILEDLGSDYMTVSDIAARYGLHRETIRRLIRQTKDDGTKVVKAPSKAVQQGGMVIYLFTKDDVEELDAYMSKRGHVAQVNE